ncbi:Phenylalanine--tRNA ligase beta subunit [bioreactor metagenome]|uniref:Phenylalanine--tRNA ligase beta subunit n=1 Tax=bioreactor metagenome TaxID=1076179 RepID=A0A645GTP4_9ZZZZ
MRQSLLFGGLESIAYNINRKHADLKLYEFGNCYHYNAENKKEGETLAAYSENFHLGIWITGQQHGASWVTADQKSSFYDLKAYVDNILQRMGIHSEKLNIVEHQDDLLSDALIVQTSGGKQLAVMGIVLLK